MEPKPLNYKALKHLLDVIAMEGECFESEADIQTLKERKIYTTSQIIEHIESARSFYFKYKKEPALLLQDLNNFNFYPERQKQIVSYLKKFMETLTISLDDLKAIDILYENYENWVLNLAFHGKLTKEDK